MDKIMLFALITYLIFVFEWYGSFAEGLKGILNHVIYLLSIPLGIYILGIPLSMIYFNFKYIATHSLLDYLFFGFVVQTLKGFVWFLFL